MEYAATAPIQNDIGPFAINIVQLDCIIRISNKASSSCLETVRHGVIVCFVGLELLEASA